MIIKHHFLLHFSAYIFTFVPISQYTILNDAVRVMAMKCYLLILVETFD